MTGADVIPDRDELRRVAARRTRTGGWVILVLVVLALLVVPVAVLIATRGSLSGGEIVILLVPLLAALAAGLVVVRWMRRRMGEPQLLAGADRGTRRAVQQALRTGQARDARVDALAREAADRTVRNSWLLIFYGVLLVVQIGLLIGRITSGDDWWEIVLTGGVALCWAAAMGVFWVMRARSRRYLQNEPGSVH
jgi:hypothetical protein